MIVCHCEQVNDQTVDHAVAAGARDIEAVASASRAGSNCGGCHDTIEALIERCEQRLDAAASQTAVA